MKFKLRNIKLSRYFKPTRLYVDLIGPIIDISRIKQFKDLDCRFDSENNIARKLRSEELLKNNEDHKSISSEDVLEIVSNSLKDKAGLELIDKGVIAVIIQAIEYGIKIDIVSTVSDSKVFEDAKKSLQSYLSVFFPNLDIEGKIEFERLDREIKVNGDPKKTKGEVWAEHLKKDASKHYILVLNDEPAEYFFTADDQMLYDEWIPGFLHAKQLQQKFQDVFESRNKVTSAAAFAATLVNEINITSTGINDTKFKVYDENKRHELTDIISNIKKMIQSSLGSKPLCIFLGGPPGSGKSFFVKQLAKKLGYGELPFVTNSLSGVSEEKYCEAIETHIANVFNQKEQNGVSIAFLDEVDTTVNDNTSFRYLMDPMTGTATDSHGVSLENGKNAKADNLVWFFAGSIGKAREEFIRKLEKFDPKVHDFFDRIHFYIDLPGITMPIEAILQAIIVFEDIRKSILDKSDKAKKITIIERKAIILIGSVNWRSARQLQTICRIASLELNEDDDTITFQCFEKAYKSYLLGDIFNAVRNYENTDNLSDEIRIS